MHEQTIVTAASSTCAELVQAGRRDVLRAGLMGLADDLDRHRDMARLVATADGEGLPSIIREYLEGLPATFKQLTEFVDHDLLERFDHLDGYGVSR